MWELYTKYTLTILNVAPNFKMSASDVGLSIFYLNTTAVAVANMQQDKYSRMVAEDKTLK